MANAVAAADDGDTLLVDSGTYASFEVVDKDLDIVAREGASVRVYSCMLRDLSAGKELVLSGIELDGSSGLQALLVVTDCAGSVRIVEVEVRGGAPSGKHGVLVDHSQDVAFFHCEIEGGRGTAGSCAGRAGDGLAIVGSTVALYGSDVRGGRSFTQPGTQEFGGDGGRGCVVSGGSTLRAFSSTIRGASGGAGDMFTTFCPCGAGGAGLAVTDVASRAEVLGCVLTGAPGGPTFGGAGCGSGPASSGNVVTIAGPARSISVDRVARGGGNLTGLVRGAPGDVVFLLISTHATNVPLPALNGVLHTSAPYVVRGLLVGQVGFNGTLPLSGPVVGFGNTLVAEHLYIQPIVTSPTGRWLGDPDVVILLAPGL